MHGISIRDRVHCNVCVYVFVCVCMRYNTHSDYSNCEFLNGSLPTVYHIICGSTGIAGVSIVDSAHVLHMHV